jgi:hypothetical protein
MVFNVSGKRSTVLVSLFLVGVVLWSVVLSACGGRASVAVPDQPSHPQPFLALHICGDNTGSYPARFLQEAARNIADRIDSNIRPGMGGMFVDFSLVEANSLQDSYVSFSVAAIDPLPPKPQPGNDPYAYAKALKEWKKAIQAINSRIVSVRASIQPSLDKLRSLHLTEVGGTDIPGCADTAAGQFSRFPSANKMLLYISDMQSNVGMNVSKQINLLGAKVRTIFRVCQAESQCEQTDSFWLHMFTKQWNASSYEVFDPATSSAEKITF